MIPGGPVALVAPHSHPSADSTWRPAPAPRKRRTAREFDELPLFPGDDVIAIVIDIVIVVVAIVNCSYIMVSAVIIFGDYSYSHSYSHSHRVIESDVPSGELT